MNGQKAKRAVCIKDGYMKNGSQFCKAGCIYLYKIFYGSSFKHPYDVMTRNTSAFNHSMSKSFFYEYFQPLHDFLSEDLFEI